MLRGIGALLVLCGCTSIGLYAAARYAVRIRLLSEWEQALQYLQGEIAYSGCDILELFERLAFRGGVFAPFFSEMAGRLRSCDGQRFYTHWGQALLGVEGYQSLPGEDKEIFLAIGANLGNLDRETQLHTLELFRRRLETNLAAARKEYRSKAKICCVTGVTMGLLLAILLI